MRQTRTIPATSAERLANDVAVLNRRAKRLDVAPFVLEISPPRVERYDDEEGRQRFREVCDATITGAPIMLSGWRLLARVDHLRDEQGNHLPVVAMVDDRWRHFSELLTDLLTDSRDRCDHCRVSRQRNAVYVVEHETGTLKIVGSTCLRDFTGYGRDPEALFRLASAVISLLDGYGDGLGLGGGSDAFDLVAFLSYVAMDIRQNGWVSRAKARDEMTAATADIALAAITRPSKAPRPSRSDRAVALLARRWAQRLTPGDLFEQNLQAIAQAGYVVHRVAGFAAAMVSSFLKMQERRRAQGVVDVHKVVGVPGSRATLAVKVLSVKAFEGNYGTKHQVLMVDKSGATVIWWAAGKVPEPIKPGAEITINASVKAHEEYRGCKQTIVQRCKVV